MHYFLKDIPLEEAQSIFESKLKEKDLLGILSYEEISIQENLMGRILAEPIYARIPVPSYNSSAMDGFAINCLDSKEASISSPVQLEIGLQTKYVDTGDPVNDLYNSVVPIEEVDLIDRDGFITAKFEDSHFIRIRESIHPWKNIRPLGEDISLNQFLLAKGHVLNPIDLGIIAACGMNKITVTKKPQVAVIPTGSELISIGKLPNQGEIIDSNSLMLSCLIQQWGGEVSISQIIADEKEAILNIIQKAIPKNDLIILIAGTSAGSEDYSANVINELGQVLVHGIAIKPGHPLILGLVKNGRGKWIPIIGVPGFPASAILTMELFVKKLISIWLGKDFDQNKFIEAFISRKITSPAGDDDFVRVSLAKVGEKIQASPLSRGSGVLTSISNSDGILLIPSGLQGYQSGEKVNIQLTSEKEEIERNILAIGSHDLLLDEVCRFLWEKYRRKLKSINVGSIGGLIALERKECHVSGSHLLDPDFGEYNIRYIKDYIKNISVRVFTLSEREQGFILSKGNPKKITKLNDLVNNEVRFINRQKGSGTRILLDYHLGIEGINKSIIPGYEMEEYTHNGVAGAVYSGRADCGLGIAAAAFSYQLDFIPLFKERYDLIFNEEFIKGGQSKYILDVISDKNFKASVSNIKGYDIRQMGQEIKF